MSTTSLAGMFETVKLTLGVIAGLAMLGLEEIDGAVPIG
jgi:hypothetical protein